MAKRFTDTEIWDQDWFIELPNKYKLFWFYVKDKCDSAGFWRPNKSNFQKIVGEPVAMDDFIKFVNADQERIKLLPSYRWFIKEYFVFQYGDKFSPTSQVHKAALKILVQNGVHPSEILFDSIGNLKNLNIQQIKEIAYDKDIDTLNIAYGNPTRRVKDKDKDIDKDKDKSKGVKFDEKFEKVFFEDGSWQLLGSEQKTLAETNCISPVTIIKGSIY